MTTHEKHFKPGDQVIVRKVELPEEKQYLEWPLDDRDSAVGEFAETEVLSNFGFGPAKGGRQCTHVVLISNGVDWEPINFWDEEVELFEPEKFDTEGVTAAKNIAQDAYYDLTDEKADMAFGGYEAEVAERIIEALKTAGVEFPDGLPDPHKLSNTYSNGVLR